jgi:hypothetical protein
MDFVGREIMTSKSVLRQQEAEYVDRIAMAAASLSSDKVDVQEKAEEVKNVRERDYQHTYVARLRKTAELLEAAQAAQGAEPAEPIKRTVDDLESVNASQAENLKAKGMGQIKVLREQDDLAIRDVDGIGNKTVADIREEIGYPEAKEDDEEDDEG